MNNVYEDGIWINVDKLAEVIYNGTILDVGSTSITQSEAHKLAANIIRHHRNYDDIAKTLDEAKDMLNGCTRNLRESVCVV